MLPSDVNDFQLAQEIKKNSSNDFITEAISRFSGCYVSVVNNYTFVPKYERDQLILDKDTNIYNYVLDYDDSRNTKLSTYISQRVRWQCMSKVNSYKEPEQVNEQLVGENDAQPDGKDLIEKALTQIQNKRFAQIVKLRYLGDNLMTWKEIGVKMGYSHELVRGIYLDNFPKLKKIIEKEMGKV